MNKQFFWLCVVALLLVSDVVLKVRSANPAAGKVVLYEVQIRSANACHPNEGADWQKQQCLNKLAPNITYNSQDPERCDDATLAELQKIKLGTFEDFFPNTTDYRAGITFRYIKERVGANMIWVMPIFPNNDFKNLPHPCDNLGSPYASRDYLHPRGSLSQACIRAGRDEHDKENPCWGTESLKEFIKRAHSEGLKVMLDIAFNHFGHGYQLYDYYNFLTITERLRRGQNLDDLWNFDLTYEQDLLYPTLLDSPQNISTFARSHPQEFAAFQSKCGNYTNEMQKVRAFNMWRNAFEWERQSFNCTGESLEYTLPSYYLGSDSWNPSTGPHDSYTNNWVDVKFLFHQGFNVNRFVQYARVREYLFRVMNYYLSLGVDGFRLDHATDHNSGISPDEWKYVTWKLNYYARKRGQDIPIYLAEEFDNQMGMNGVVDLMTEGYVGDMRRPHVKDTNSVEKVISSTWRFGGKSYVMTALETHDEHRLFEDTGFNIWTGAGFWGIGATIWSVPMILMGQEFGEPWQLGFKRSDYLRSRFVGTNNYNPQGDALIGYYGNMIRARLEGNNPLVKSNQHFLRTRDSRSSIDSRIFAQMKWGDGDVIFTFHNLWEVDVANSYYIPPDVSEAALIKDDLYYNLYDLISKRNVNPRCIKGSDLKWSFYVSLDAATRSQWLRLELCR